MQGLSPPTPHPYQMNCSLQLPEAACVDGDRAWGFQGQEEPGCGEEMWVPPSPAPPSPESRLTNKRCRLSCNAALPGTLKWLENKVIFSNYFFKNVTFRQSQCLITAQCLHSFKSFSASILPKKRKKGKKGAKQNGAFVQIGELICNHFCWEARLPHLAVKPRAGLVPEATVISPAHQHAPWKSYDRLRGVELRLRDPSP